MDGKASIDKLPITYFCRRSNTFRRGFVDFLARKQKRALAHPLLLQRHRRAFVLFLKTFNLRESVLGNAFNPRVSIHAKPAHDEVSVLRKKLAAHLSVRPITRAFVRPN